jgi:hypothetical protein
LRQRERSLRPSLHVSEPPDWTGCEPVNRLREVTAPRVLQRRVLCDLEHFRDLGDACKLGGHVVKGIRNSWTPLLRSSLDNCTMLSYRYPERRKPMLTQPQFAETGEPLRVIEVTPAQLPIPEPQVPDFDPGPIETPDPVEVPA